MTTEALEAAWGTIDAALASGELDVEGACRRLIEEGLVRKVLAYPLADNGVYSS